MRSIMVNQVQEQRGRSVYVHVPFCAHKCAYCAFYSHLPDRATVDRYVSALIQEMEWVGPGLAPRTVFFGGGTPSILNRRQWQRIMETMEHLGWLGADEWTIECNPATVSSEKAKLFRDYGVNRISMGVQSLNENLLERLGRIHTRRMVFDSFDTLRAAGFDSINLDLMFGIPGQSLDIWRETLDEILAFESEHLACYELTYEDDTPLLADLRAGRVTIDEALNEQLYEELVQRLARHGVVQYEVSNFARPSGGCGDDAIPDRACRHNINYWRGGEYHALGPSAAGYVDAERTLNIANTEIYCREIEQGQWPVDYRETLSPLARAGEAAAFGLRMNAGWPYDLFRRTTGFDLEAHWGATIDNLVRIGWGVRDADRFRLTPEGIRFADAAGAEFLISKDEDVTSNHTLVETADGQVKEEPLTSQ